MELTAQHSGTLPPRAHAAAQPKWERITLLSVLGYEGMGCFGGGVCLVAAPDGHLMDMPVRIMHGLFPDFFIPGLILLGLGILNMIAFIAVLRRTSSGWIMTSLALGGLAIWFAVQISILQMLHWLHFIWGLPVLLGIVTLIPLIRSRHLVLTVDTNK